MVRTLRQRAARMQRLLEYREQLVEEAQRRFAEEQRFVAACETALAQLEASQRALAVSLATLAGKSVDATLLSGAEAYQAWLSQRRDEREAALAEAKRRAEAARAALVAQRREAKKVELCGRAGWARCGEPSSRPRRSFLTRLRTAKRRGGRSVRSGWDRGLYGGDHDPSRDLGDDAGPVWHPLTTAWGTDCEQHAVLGALGAARRCSGFANIRRP